MKSHIRLIPSPPGTRGRALLTTLCNPAAVAQTVHLEILRPTRTSLSWSPSCTESAKVKNTRVAFIRMMRRRVADQQEEKDARVAAIGPEANALCARLMSDTCTPLTAAEESRLDVWYQVSLAHSGPNAPRAVATFIAMTREDLATNDAAKVEAEANLTLAKSA
ncbi:hypothetical protein ACHAPU_008081 [Fusarium lateritium]